MAMDSRPCITLPQHPSIVPLIRIQEVMEALAASGGPQLWNARASSGGITPLHLAAATGDHGLVRWLVLERRVGDPNVLDDKGMSALDMVEQANQTTVSEVLREL